MCLFLSKVCRQFKPIRQLILTIEIELVKWLGKFHLDFYVCNQHLILYKNSIVKSIILGGVNNSDMVIKSPLQWW